MISLWPQEKTKTIRACWRIKQWIQKTVKSQLLSRHIRLFSIRASKPKMSRLIWMKLLSRAEACIKKGNQRFNSTRNKNQTSKIIRQTKRRQNGSRNIRTTSLICFSIWFNELMANNASFWYLWKLYSYYFITHWELKCYWECRIKTLLTQRRPFFLFPLIPPRPPRPPKAPPNPPIPPIPPILFIISSICGLFDISFIMFMILPAPPSCCIIWGVIICWILLITWWGFLCMFTLSGPKLVFPTVPISFFSFLCSSRRIFTYMMLVPEPFAILLILDSSVIGWLLSSSSGVIESMI